MKSLPLLASSLKMERLGTWTRRDWVRCECFCLPEAAEGSSVSSKGLSSGQMNSGFLARRKFTPMGSLSKWPSPIARLEHRLPLTQPFLSCMGTHLWSREETAEKWPLSLLFVAPPHTGAANADPGGEGGRLAEPGPTGPRVDLSSVACSALCVLRQDSAPLQASVESSAKWGRGW